MQCVVWLLESAFSGPIWAKSMRDSGIPQAVRDIDLPEPATYKPYWLQRSSTTSKDEVVVEDKPVQERLDLASQAIPGTTLAASCAAIRILPLQLIAYTSDCKPLLGSMPEQTALCMVKLGSSCDSVWLSIDLARYLPSLLLHV